MRRDDPPAGDNADLPAQLAVTEELPPTASALSVSALSADESKANAALDPLVGTILADRYEVIRRIGEGGMGAVYEARHILIGKRVAVKVLLERLVEKRDLVARLLKEARLASAIGHENIVDVTDFGTTDDARSFVVMEYLEGEPLSALLTREAPLQIERCLHIVKQVVSALAAAHAKGIVHRDIKPENIYLIKRGDEDFVKVVDFGVSKAVRTADEGPETLRLTRTGMLLGTPLYMSPEQARGDEDIDSRADIWAVGIVLYECLTGEVPFRANNYLQVIAQVLNHEALAPSKMLPDLGIPSAVEAVVMKALAKDRQERYQHMTDLQRDLERLIAGDPNVTLDDSDSARRVEPTRIGPRWHLGIAAVLLVGAGLAVSLAQPKKNRDASTSKRQAQLQAKDSNIGGRPPVPRAPAPLNPQPVSPTGEPALDPNPNSLLGRPRLGRHPKPAAEKAKPAEDADKPIPGGNIRFVGDDVAPSSDKVFGRKHLPNVAGTEGAR